MKQHYAWPILPWLFLAAAYGAQRLFTRHRRMASIWISVALVVTVADNPALQRIFATRVSEEAVAVRRQLTQVRGETVLAQGNLVPHLPRPMRSFAVEGVAHPEKDPDLVLLTQVGDLWPLTPSQVADLVQAYRSDAQYVESASGPLFAFTLKSRAK